MLPLLALTLTVASAQPPSASADELFAAGLAVQFDAGQARPKFVEAAKAYDAAWADGVRTRAAACNRGRAHALAGDVAGAIASVQAGLRRFPHDADLHRDLETYRDAVNYPTPVRPEERLRPTPPGEWRHRIATSDLFLFAGLGLLLVVIGVARRFTVRDSWAVPVACVGLVGLLLAGVGGWLIRHDGEVDSARPLMVLRADTFLRKGNGETHPARIDTRLPRGAELRERHRRGGWVQVEVPGGAIGWLPEQVLLPVE